ncbi:MAG: radical SAM family heme chaperone HemW [Candidatus Jidaibacter sp.]|jgi:oxygen-independent coproporphyrinogen-3 oxidase|nr:radical SAM family heme chaperone HemW [Candidatus Jidaibacter sp.]
MKCSIYIHWPFCKSKCPYCDFNSHVRDGIDHSLWRASLIKEIDYYSQYLKDKEIVSIFFGGGTPSLAHESVISGIIEHLAKNYNLPNIAEITMEANPTSVESSKFKAIAAAGVNRVSLGIQSLYEKNLKFLGREHSAFEAKAAIEVARKYFSKFSFDLIYALPKQSLNEWAAELQEAKSLADGHLSLYQLTIEKGTKFFSEHKQGRFTLPDEDLAADMYTLTEEILEPDGYKTYEVSNYAKPGHECIHNLQYWQYGEYLGIGPGAHGRIKQGNSRYATQNISSPEEWLKLVNITGAGLQRNEALNQEDILKETVIMGLRTSAGVVAHPLMNKQRITTLCDNGLLELIDNKLITTNQGRLLLNSVIKYLLSKDL